MYVYNDVEKEYKFYQVFDISKDKKEATVKQIMTAKEKLPFHGYFDVDFDKVGVYIFLALQSSLTTIKMEDISGKAMRVLHYVMSIPKNVLLEAT